MARHDTALSTLQSRTILYVVDNISTASLSNDGEIVTEGLHIIDFLQEEFPDIFPSGSDEHEDAEILKTFLPFTLSSLARKAIREGSLTVLDYVSMLSDIKCSNETERNDFGAFGDLVEILVRCFFMRSIHLVNWRTLTVKAVSESDMVSKKYGIVEIGHNGKTLTFGNLFDYMAGDYTSIVYGMFSDDDKKEIYRLCKEGDLLGAIEYVSEYMCYWSDKREFRHDMDNLTRGKGITAKSCGIQVVYNPGKYNAFQNAIENGNFITLADLVK